MQEGADADECAVGEDVLSDNQRCHRTGHHQGHSGWRTVIRIELAQLRDRPSQGEPRSRSRAISRRATGKKICSFDFLKTQEQESLQSLPQQNRSQELLIARLAQYLQQREGSQTRAPLCPEEKPAKGRLKKKRAEIKPQFDLREGFFLFAMTGTDFEPDRQHRNVMTTAMTCA